MLQLAPRQIERHHIRTLLRQPPSTLRRATADLEYPFVGHRAEQMCLVLIQALWSPQEPRVAEERAVLLLVPVRSAVPPPPISPNGLLVTRLTPSHELAPVGACLTHAATLPKAQPDTLSCGCPHSTLISRHPTTSRFGVIPPSSIDHGSVRPV